MWHSSIKSVKTISGKRFQERTKQRLDNIWFLSSSLQNRTHKKIIESEDFINPQKRNHEPPLSWNTRASLDGKPPIYSTASRLYIGHGPKGVSTLVLLWGTTLRLTPWKQKEYEIFRTNWFLVFSALIRNFY